MIQIQDILIAGKGKLLYYPAENIVWGKADRLAIYKCHQLTVDDFSEIDEIDVVDIDSVDYVFYNRKYVDIVEFVPPPPLYIRCSDRLDAKLSGVSESVSGKIQRDTGVEEINKRGGKAPHRETGGMIWI